MTTHSPTPEDPHSPSSSTDAKKRGRKPRKPSKPSKKQKVGQAIIKIPRACKKNIEKFFYGLRDNPEKLERYLVDWGLDIKPRSEHGELNRWRFAFCTVHTPWLRSCEQYQDIQHSFGNINKDTLEKKLSLSAGGMFKIKAQGIDNLHNLWSSTRELFDSDGLSSRAEWRSWRNKLTRKLDKLGMAKTSFAIEMLQPLKAKVICIDRHMFKAFGWENVDISSTNKQYEYYEDYWLDLSAEYGVPPVISRNIFWDNIQNEPTSMYWGNYLKDYVYTARN